MRWHACTGPLALLTLVVACTSPRGTLLLPGSPAATSRKDGAISGRIEQDALARRSTQASLGQITQSATVTVSDAGTGKLVATTVASPTGAFTLSLANLTAGTTYWLDATRGVAADVLPGRAGSPALRLRTMLLVQGGTATSLTNTASAGSLVIGNATTAAAVMFQLRQQTGTSLTAANLIGKVNEGTDTFTETGTGLANAADFQAVLPLVGNCLVLDLDPVAGVAYQSNSATYRMATNLPRVTGLSTTRGGAGDVVTVNGSSFDPYPGRLGFSFGGVAASTWSVQPDRRSVQVTIPAGALGGPFLMHQPGGVAHTLAPVFKLRQQVVTLAGSGRAGSRDGNRFGAELNAPRGLAIDTRGNLVVADHGSHKIRQVSPAGEVSTIAGDGVSGLLDGPATAARFSSPRGVCAEANGTIYVAEEGNKTLRRIDPEGRVTTLTTDATFVANPANAQVWGYGLAGVARDPAGNLYVTDYMGCRIWKIVPGGGIFPFVGYGPTSGGRGGYNDGLGTVAGLSFPDGIVLGRDGNLYCGSNGENHVKQITLAGQTRTLDSSGFYRANPGTWSGAYTTAITCQPCVLADGSTVGGTQLTRVAPGMGQIFYRAAAGGTLDGPDSAFRFGQVHAAVADADGAIYLSDPVEHRIRVWVP
jgi:sugar lactone lactonase YvrE